ncbi:MAG: CARDB domain-containing protein [candidate division WOR-3 bacterium]
MKGKLSILILLLGFVYLFAANPWDFMMPPKDGKFPPDRTHLNKTCSIKAEVNYQGTDQPPFGTVVRTFYISTPTSYAGGGITWAKAINKFYLLQFSSSYVDGIYKVDFDSLTIRQVVIQNRPNFGGSTADLWWGIAYNDRSGNLWVTSVTDLSTTAPCYAIQLTKMNALGDTFRWMGTAADSFNLWTCEANYWYAGMDYCPQKRYFYIAKAYSASQYRWWQVDLDNKEIKGYKENTSYIYAERMQSCFYRPLSAVPPGTDTFWVLTGGWNSGQIKQFDTNATFVRSAAANPYYCADIDIWEPINVDLDSTVYAFMQFSVYDGSQVIVQQVSMGLKWGDVIRVHDAKPTAILSPSLNIDTTAAITPTVKVKNSGSYTESFWTYFTIEHPTAGLLYSDSLFLQDIPSGKETLLTYTPWTAHIRDTILITLRTYFEGDEFQRNDTLRQKTFVRVLDAGVVTILVPKQDTILNVGDLVQPKAIVKNFGNVNTGSFNLWFRIGTVFTEFVQVSDLAPGEEREVSASGVWEAEGGSWTCQVNTALTNDMNPTNNLKLSRFIVGEVDVGPTRIVWPAGMVQWDTLTPKPVKAKIKNYSANIRVSTQATFQIKKGDSLYFDATVSVSNLEPGEEREVTFGNFLPKDTGAYNSLVYTMLAGDRNPNNDTLRGSFVVTKVVIPAGWSRMTDVSGAAKPVKSGGALCALGDKIYALVGNNTRDLMVYDVNANTWTKKSEVPLSGLTTKKKNVKKGASICTDGENIYVIKGNNTQEFWRYKIEKDSWKEYEVGFSKGIKGSSQAFDGDSFIYVICGSSNNEWKRFNRYTETFEACNPAALPADKWKTGSWIVYVPGETPAIYALRVGGKTNEFYMIPIGGTPATKPEMPLVGSTNKKKKAKEGSAGAYVPSQGRIYALKGGNTLEFFSFNTANDSWKIELDVGQPAGTPAKKVKGGGALTYSEAGNGAFAFVGSGTNEFWCFGFSSELMASKSLPTAIQGNVLNNKEFVLTITPTRDYLKVSYTLPVNTKASLKIYNILGEIVYNATSDKGSFVIDKKNFATGIYILKFVANEYRATKKLVIH